MAIPSAQTLTIITKPTKCNLPNQTYRTIKDSFLLISSSCDHWMCSVRSTCVMWKSLRGFSGVICWMVDFVKAVNVWVRNTFGNVYIVLVANDDKKILEGLSENLWVKVPKWESRKSWSDKCWLVKVRQALMGLGWPSLQLLQSCYSNVC